MKKQEFGAVGIALAIVAAGIIGLTGWYVISNNNPKRENPIDEVSISNQVEVITEAHDSAENSNLEQDYLYIDEWRVRIPLSPEIKGAYYKINDSFKQSLSDPTSLIVYSEETDNLTGIGGVSCKGEYIAYLQRFPSNDPYWQSLETDADLFRPTVDIDGFTYGASAIKQYAPLCFYTDPNNDVYESDQVTEEKFDVLVNIFMSDFKEISSISR